MSKIDFSKAPEGATHYRSGVSDTTLWYKKDPTINPIGYHWVWWCEAIEEWSSCGVGAIEEATKIPKQLTLPICKNEREAMLCRQVLRMCRGEASEFKDHSVDEWYTKDGTGLNINTEYRAKPKKELVVPWEWLPDVVVSIEVKSNGRILGHSKNESSLAIEFTTALKLDLTDIELPVTVERPTC